ncbi:hypothetical protein FRB94_002995 [Tulasnella sp. JGI-2019a]|nr:hypothetical protein FRB93_004022 [Tulasnella sp. JGI-2019a]KAG9003672.1 hypothetical protein FRB94_002995 [Tulasnella sp. JGI-2019a]
MLLHLRLPNFLLLSALLGLLEFVFAVDISQFNSTVIDDTDPIINYQPPDAWIAVNKANPKPGGATPDASQAYNSSWHDSTFYIGDSLASIEFPFNGTGLAVYCILWHLQNANATPTSIPDLSLTSLVFTFDGNPAGNYTSGPYQDPGTTRYGYNTSVYQNFNMSNGRHTFSLNLEPNSMILFDYAVIYQNGSSSSNIQVNNGKNISTGAIRGIIGAASVLLSSILLLIAYGIYRRRQRRARRMTFDIDDGHLPDPNNNVLMQEQGPISYHPVDTFDPYVVNDNHADRIPTKSQPDRSTSPLRKGRRPNPAGDDGVGAPLIGGSQPSYPTIEVEDDAEDAGVFPNRLPPPYKSRLQADS